MAQSGRGMRWVLAAAGILLAVLAVGYLLGANNGAGTVTDVPTAEAPTVEAPTAAGLDGTSWSLTGWSVSSLALDGQTVDLEFVDGRVSGTSAVNVYNADYTATAEGALQIGMVATTKMAGPDEAMRVEQMYLTLLQAVGGWQLEGDTLTLLDANGQPSLIFTRK